jgi:cobyrinic acid a,c-diamide synthase
VGGAERNAAILSRQCPALLISAPASGQGKTTVTAALARSLQSRGLRPRVFKTGADFLDPMILERASGAPVHQLDLWMVGEGRCRRLLYDAAGEADVILVEGVMGLFDGDPSSADLAARLGLPVLAVIDASAMAQTFGAVAHGLAHYRSDIQVVGVIANRVAGPGHAEMLAHSVENGVEYLGYLPQNAEFALPERHLGLFQAREVADIDTRLDSAARAIEACGRYQPPMVTFHAQEDDDVPPLLDGVRIGVARDAAFSFIYPANLDLQRQQAQLSDKLGDRHPDMVKIQLAIQTAESRIQGEIAKGVQSLKNDYETAQSQEQSLMRALEQQKQDALALNGLLKPWPFARERPMRPISQPKLKLSSNVLNL